MAERQYVTFYLDDDYFGISILLVREINRNLEITPVELAPPYVHGVLNLRGQIVTVLDLGVRIGLGPRKIGNNTSCIVLKTTSELGRNCNRIGLAEFASPDHVGLLVDYIGDVIAVDESEVDPPPPHAGGVRGHFFDGVIKLDKRLLVTLDMSRVLALGEAVVQV